MQQTTRLESTFHAIRAAQNWDRWGPDAARRYALNRGVHPSLIRLARQLEAAA